MDDEMDLPPGASCGECLFWPGCKELIASLKPTNTRCDWSPSRYRPGTGDALARSPNRTNETDHASD